MTSYYQTMFALGCDIGLCIVHDNQKLADEIFVDLWRTISEFESNYSRFNNSSELTLFNKKAGIFQPISEEFKHLLALSNSYNNSTKGLFNIYVLPVLQKVGYSQSFMPIPNSASSKDFSNRELHSSGRVEISGNTAFIPKNTAIDLGGIAKGFLGDKLADIVEDKVYGYWFSLGGDIIVGGKNEHGKPWTIAIESLNDSIEIEITNNNSSKYAVATSGVTKRRGTKDNTDWHHIIDPRTGHSSAQDIVQSTIIAPTAAEADVLATCAIISGSKKYTELLQNHSVHDAIIQRRTTSNKFEVLQIGNLIKVTTNNKSEVQIKEATHA